MEIKCVNCKHFRGYKDSYLKECQTKLDELEALRKHKNWFVRVFCAPSGSQIDWAKFYLKEAQDNGRCVLKPEWVEVGKMTHYCSQLVPEGMKDGE